MRRAAALGMVFSLLAAVAAGCKDDNSVNVAPSGIEVRFTDCLVFGVNIFINNQYQGTASSERPRFFAVAPGSYTFYARSNAREVGREFYCWERSITVSDGKTTVLTMSCKGALCSQ